jgi:hypothetical protein
MYLMHENVVGGSRIIGFPLMRSRLEVDLMTQELELSLMEDLFATCALNRDNNKQNKEN